MKKINLFIFFCFTITIGFLSNISGVKASTTCTFKMEALETAITSTIYTPEYYTIEINMDSKTLTFTNVYYDENIKSDSNDYSVKRGEKKTFTFDEMLDYEYGLTVYGPGENDAFELDFRAIAGSPGTDDACNFILYEQLKGTNIYRFRYKASASEPCGEQNYDDSYGPTTCLDNGVDPLDKYTCSPSVGTNSYTKIKYSFSTDEKKMVIEFPNKIKQVLDLKSIEDSEGMFAIFDAKDCTECFDEYHTTASGRVEFSQIVPIFIDEELSNMLFSSSSNSCPSKIYAMLTFYEMDDTYKPQFFTSYVNTVNVNNDIWASVTNEISKGWGGTLGTAFVDYITKLENYTYSDYNYATIVLTTKDCGNECFSVTTSDTLVIIDETKNNLDLGEVENCQYLKTDEFYGWLRGLLKIIRIGAIILVIILTGLDALKSFTSFDEKNNKSFYKHLLNRLMCIAILFLAPSVIKLLISVFNVNDVISEVAKEPFCGLL